MADEGPNSNSKERKTIIDRANRMLEQSKTLRKLSDELLQESRDIRKAAQRATKPRNSGSTKRR